MGQDLAVLAVREIGRARWALPGPAELQVKGTV